MTIQNVAKHKICEKCGKSFAPRTNRAKWCDACYMFTCEWCGKSFENRRASRRTVRFCSLECANAWQATPEAKEEARQRTLEKRGSGEVRRCPTCEESFYTPGWLVRQGNGNHCSNACRDRTAEQKGITRVLRFPHQTTPNGLESAGAAILDGLEIDYLEQQVIGGKFVVDVLIPSSAIIIQWDGDFWHANPRVYSGDLYAIQATNKKRDKACNAYLEKCGYKVLRFWESDVHSRPSWVASRVRSTLASSEST